MPEAVPTDSDKETIDRSPLAPSESEPPELHLIVETVRFIAVGGYEDNHPWGLNDWLVS